jgi:amino acid adenylation domain-containing protein
MSVYHLQPGNHFVEFEQEEVEQSIPARFEKQVAKNPNHLALKTSSHQLSYNDFNRIANQIARAVRRWSRGNHPVALLFEHGASAIVAAFGVLKAGKSFVPLDPSLPRSRLQYMSDDVSTNLIVTNHRCLAVARELREKSRRILNVDRLEDSLATDNLGISISPDSLSCILYTSGTTGRPKGVMHTHRNELHNVKNHTNSLFLSSDDRLTLLGSYSTGQGMQDFYCALLNGATLFPWSLKSDGLANLAEWLVRERITVYHSAATVFRHLVRNLSDKDEFPDLRIIRLGSEQVSWRDVDAYKKHFSKKCIFVNALSSSETKTVRQYIIDHETQISGIVPIGYPVPDMEILLFDETGKELGPGFVGEIAVRSRYLSPGYWQNPVLTSASFQPGPSDAESHIFRTGEWGRMSGDGCLEHLGRKDAQVKIRGYRVETIETELALLRHPAAAQVLVLCRENIRGDKCLIAYLVPNGPVMPPVVELRAFLKDKIPEYMIPSAFVFLESLPITPNGKVDLNALPKSSSARPVLDAPFVPPNGPIEEVLANIWVEILGIDEVGIHDNHFDLGGNSLSAMQVVAQIEKAFRVPMPLARFFESPTIASLSRNLSMTLGAAPELKLFPLERIARDKPLPLSFAQQRLWFLDQWEPGSAVYNICRAFHLRGRINVRAMEESLEGIVERHEVLRTAFPVLDGQPVQTVATKLKLPLRVINLRRVPKTEQSDQSLRIVKEDAGKPFDLVQGPLFRATLLHLADEVSLFVFTVHQIVCDGWSMRVFYREFWKSYEAHVSGKRQVFPELPIQYADYAVWQRQRLQGQGEVLELQLAHWKRQFKSKLPVLSLPTDRPRPSRQNFCGARQPVVIDQPLTEAVKDLSNRNGATLFITLITAFKILLFHETGQEDLVVGFPIANRNWAETAGLIGCFVNTLALRTDLSGKPTFKELLSRVRENCIAAYTHRDLPFEKLVGDLHIERDMSRNPIFQSMFVFQVTERLGMDIQGITLEPIDVDAGTSKFDLTVSLAERDKRLVGFFEYSTDLFDRNTIERMAGHYQSLLEGIVSDPEQPIATLPILTAAERHRILIEWNDTAADYPKDKCIHELFEDQVQRTPDAIALEFEEKRITYRNLNRRANQLAHYLLSLGIGQEKPVGICIERSIEMIVGLLGILKAGGAYVPLEPAYPKERLQFMLEDAQVSIVLTTERIMEDKGWKTEYGEPHAAIRDPRLQIVCLDRDSLVIGKQRANNPSRRVGSNVLAYVLYTSGSTGQPKGVQIQHRSVVNCFSSIGKQIDLMSQDVWLAVTTISFDIAALELYLPLISGAKIILANQEECVDGAQLLARLKASRATVMQATPSIWKLLVDTGWERRDGFKILCGGEALARQLADRLLDRSSSVWNLYGPTESTIWSTVARITPDERPVSIGRPIANTQIYILDSHLQPVPIGVAGELLIGGDGLARGYLSRPELTLKKFIPNPFSDNPDSRLFRTGDRAKYRADGNIEFLGRVDNQVKIRGHRIELDEIEIILNQSPSVRESVVVARERDSSAEKELVGYVVSTQESGPPVGELRRFLQGKLPDYMVPSRFVFLNTLPLTPNGKIDRNALPPPDGERPLLDQGFVEPRTEIEELVGQVWRDLLKLDKIGVYDNFFELGGHSLLATRIVARLRSNFNVNLALRKLFELPTVAGLAQHIAFLRRSGSGSVIAPIPSVPRDQPLPLSFSQRRLWYLQKVDANLSAYNIAASFRIKGDLHVGALQQALNALIARHEPLRSAIMELGGEPHQKIVPTLQIALPAVDLSQLPHALAEEEAKRWCSEDARQLHVLEKPPLLRVKLLKLSEGDHVVILNFHHIIADGSSLAIFYQELAVLYNAARNSQAAPLPELSIQYADYAAWQHGWLKSDAFDVQLAYWKRRLADMPAPVELPTDFDHPALPAHRGARLTRQLAAELTASLKIISRQQGVTLFMTLFATFNILLSRISGQDDIVIGSSIAGRNRPETDGLIGFFINALPLRSDVSGNPSFATLLRRIREGCLDAYTNEDIPFDKIVEELKPPRSPGRNPIFDILFNIADTSERTLALPGCEVTELPQAERGAKFDIVLHAPEVDGKIELAIVYNIELFRASRIATLLDQFASLLAQVINDPEQGIDQLSLFTPSAQAVLPDPTQVLDDTWKGAIHELFAEQARRSPDKLAVIDPEQSWTFSEIDRCAVQLANGLISLGIKPKDPIAIYAHRSSSLVVSLFGILKAGATFLILDPAYPAARSIDYLRIAQPKGWLQLDGSGEPARELLDHLESLNLGCRLKIPRAKIAILQTLSRFADTEPGISVEANDPAYVAFTSGSTGEPKGVLCRHGPITHFLPWQKEAFNLDESDRFAMLSGLAYSHLHRDVFTTLSLGATLYIPDSSEARSPDRLAQWLAENTITVLHLTPALGQLILTGGGRILPSVRRVFFGGDVLTHGEVAQIRKLMPNAKIGSFYGATETQRAVGYYEIPDKLNIRGVDAKRAVPLGRGIKDVQLLLLNKNRQLAGIGELGELYVRSPHLAEGYMGDDKRTEEMFLINPFTDDPKDRIYKSGELGRYLPDGNVEWAGRNDRRVNIRGFRVELEEIETLLKQHPTVANAAVVLREIDLPNAETLNSECSDNPISKIKNAKSDLRLVAYIAAEEDGQSIVDLLRSYLSTRLPDYMVPSHFVTLNMLPLNPSGKVDYSALPPIEKFDSAATPSSQAPRSDLEAKLCDIFAQVLRRERVGVDENFFRIGGHSLLAAQAAARIRETLGVSLELRRFLEAPTVTALAKEIDLGLQGITTPPIMDDSDREEIEI